MSYLLDTNVFSELVKPKPNEKVLKWFQNVPNEALYLSVLSLGEIRKGIEKLIDPMRQEQLRVWLEIELPQWFGSRFLSIDHHVADRWGRLQNEMQRSIPAIDSLLAASALYYDLRMVTRNKCDFIYPSLIVVCPWD